MKTRVAKLNDIPQISILLNSLFMQEAELTPNNQQQESGFTSSSMLPYKYANR